jgi:type VI protein secretion system component Hcp
VTFVKCGAATPQIFQALVTNEADHGGLRPARQSAGQGVRVWEGHADECLDQRPEAYTETTATGVINELEQVSLTFQKITLQNNDGNTSASDDWRAPTA